MNPRMGIHFGQARGPFVQAGVNGLVIGMLIYMTYFTLSKESNKYIRYLLIASLSSMLITLFFTYNRTSWIAFFLSAVVFSVYTPKVRKIFVVLFLMATLLASTMYTLKQYEMNDQQQVDVVSTRLSQLDAKQAVQQRFSSMTSIYSRLNVYVTAWNMFVDNPLFGVGQNNFKKESKNYIGQIEGAPVSMKAGIAAHNTFLIILVENGIIGLGLIIFNLLNVVRKLYHMAPKEGVMGRDLVVAFSGVLIMNLISMFARETQYMMFPNALFYLFSGITVGLYQRIRTEDTVGHKQYEHSY